MLRVVTREIGKPSQLVQCFVVPELCVYSRQQAERFSHMRFIYRDGGDARRQGFEQDDQAALARGWILATPIQARNPNAKRGRQVPVEKKFVGRVLVRQFHDGLDRLVVVEFECKLEQPRAGEAEQSLAAEPCSY